MEKQEKRNVGKVTQIIGPVVDIKFDDGCLPDLLNAIEIDNDGSKVVCEVAQQIGDDVVRCIAMSSTDGMVRGCDAVDTGSGITVPVSTTTGVSLQIPAFCFMALARHQRIISVS